MLNLPGWPAGVRLIAGKERPHPGAQLRLTDIDGHRFTVFATSTKGGQIADLERASFSGPGLEPELTRHGILSGHTAVRFGVGWICRVRAASGQPASFRPLDQGP